MLAAVLFCQGFAPLQAKASSPTIEIAKVAAKTGGMGEGTALKVAAGEGKMVYKLFIPKSSRLEFTSTSPKALKQSLGQISKGVLIRFVPEAFSFYLALGAISYAKLIFNYSDNPLVLEQLNQSQVDPIGQLGFLAFMMTNSNVSAPLMAFADKHNQAKLKSFVPYLGMSAGMMASNLVHDIAHFPDLQKCVDDISKRSSQPKNYESCEKAYNSWGEVMEEKGMEYVPSLLSMLGSVFLSGMVDKYLVQKIVVAAGFGIIFSPTPAGISVKLAHFLYKTFLQTTSFLAFDELIFRPIVAIPTGIINNSRYGEDLAQTEKSIFGLVSSMQQTNWSYDPGIQKTPNTYSLDQNIRKFTDQGIAWRKFNLQKEYEVHTTWHRYMSNFISTYKATYDFYVSFLKHREQKINPKDPAFIDKILPLAGITPAIPENNKDFVFDPLANPTGLLWQQLVSLIQFKKKYLGFLDENTRNRYFPEAEINAAVKEMLLSFPTKEDWDANKFQYERIGKALLRANKLTAVENDYPGLVPAQTKSIGFFRDSRDRLLAMLDELAAPTTNPNQKMLQVKKVTFVPTPLMTPGLGYINAYEQDQKVAIIHQNLTIPQMSHMFAVFKPSEYFLTQMASGPDVMRGEKFIDYNMLSGYPAEFLPPRLTDDLRMQVYTADYPAEDLTQSRLSSTIFNAKVATFNSKTREGTTYSNLFALLRGDILRKEDFNDSKSFEAWWKENIEPKFIESWEVFDTSYRKNTINLTKKLQMRNFSDFKLGAGANEGPLSNNPLDAIRQERRAYMVILGELFKGVIVKKNPQVLKNSISNVGAPALTAAKSPVASRNLPQPTPMQILRTNTVFDFTTLTTAKGVAQNYPVAASVTGGRNLKFQDQLESDFAALEKLFDSYRVSTLDNEEILTATVRNKDFLTAQSKVEETINSIREIFGAYGKKARDVFSASSLTAFQKSTAEACLDGLTVLAGEISNYGMIANSASYTRSEVDSDDPTRAEGKCVNKLLVETKNATGRRMGVDKCREQRLNAH